MLLVICPLNECVHVVIAESVWTSCPVHLIGETWYDFPYPFGVFSK